MLRLGLAAGMAMVMSASAAGAQTFPADDVLTPAPVGVASILSDNELAGNYGTGLASPDLAQGARDEIEGFNRFTAQTLPATFENWFNDVATPLIVANLSR